MLSEEQFDSSLLAIANFVDIKSPYTLGHSRVVAELGEAAGSVLGLPPSELQTLRRAGLVLGFGRLGVSNAIWDKPGPLGAGEWERVRMHPYITERMLLQSSPPCASRCDRRCSIARASTIGLPTRPRGRSDHGCTLASSVRRMHFRRCANRGPTASARPARRRPQKSSVPKYGVDAWTAMPSKRF